MSGRARFLFLIAAIVSASAIAVTGSPRVPLPDVDSDITRGRSRILELPADLADFTDREDEFGSLCNILRRAANRSNIAAPIAVISGKAGVGKTALAVHIAHRLPDLFPDGEIYVDLRGSDERPVEPAELLGELLIELGVEPGTVPKSLDERVRRFRREMSSRRMLLLLDNAASEAQVRPLIPGSHQSATMVTARRSLAGLEGASTIELEVFDGVAARELLDKIAGKDWVGSDAKAVDDIVRLTGRLPLAVRIAAGRIAQRRLQPLSDLAARLSSERDRLNELTLGDLEVRATFMSSYQLLDPWAARVFRALSVFNVPDFPCNLVRHVLSCDNKEAERAVKELLEAQLLEVAGLSPAGELHFRYHELIRVFARDLLIEESVVERAMILKRGVETYGRWLGEAELRLVATDVHRLPMPHHTGIERVDETAGEGVPGDPLAWLKYERHALLGILEQSFAEGLHGQTCLIAERLSACAESRLLWDDWRRGLEIAHLAAKRMGDKVREARILFHAGDAFLIQEQFDEAREHLEECLEIFAELGIEQACARARLDLGYVELQLGRLDEAEDLLTRCFTFFGRQGDVQHGAEATCDLALLHLRKGNLPEAKSGLERAIAEFRELKNMNWLAFALVNLGNVNALENQIEDSLANYETALPLLQELDNRLWTAETLKCVGTIFDENGKRRLARQAWRKSYEIFLVFDHPAAGEVRALLRWWRWRKMSRPTLRTR